LRKAAADFDVEIAGVGTALPAILPAEATEHARALFPHLGRLEAPTARPGLARVIHASREWHYAPQTVTDGVFQRHALDLLEEVTLKATQAAGVQLSELGGLLVNTVTGLAIPSLDAKLMNRLDLPNSMERLPMFGLGCAGGVAGIARSARYAQARPGKSLLFLTVDLCSLCLRADDSSNAMLVSTALFGDGAAGVVLRNTQGGGGTGCGRIIATGDHFWRGTEHIMGWNIQNDGFGVVLSPELPALLSTHLRPALEGFLAAKSMSLGDFDGFLFHPGSSKILNVVQKTLGLSREDLSISYEVLRNFGNMSSPTALFALHRAIEAGARGRHLLVAFGPGFSAYSSPSIFERCQSHELLRSHRLSNSACDPRLTNPHAFDNVQSGKVAVQFVTQSAAVPMLDGSLKGACGRWQWE
jgi:alkylresorcinol/alkylpyrone synthase